MVMSPTQLMLLAAAAVIVFWMVGAYNRLVALRTAIGRAWAQVEQQLQQRRAAFESMLPALRESFGEADRDAAEALQGALMQVQASADAMRARPVSPESPAVLNTAEQALAAAQARVFALLEYHPELRDNAPAVAGARAQLVALEPQLAFARQLFNSAAERYDEAARQFPTRVLSAIYGFGPAGRL
jgi:LemA protein